MNSPMRRHLGLTAALVIAVAIALGCNKPKPTDSGGGGPAGPGPAGAGTPGAPGAPGTPAAPGGSGGPGGYVGSKMGPPGGIPAAAANNQAVVPAAGAVTPLIPVSDAKSRQISSNNLKQIGLAWQNFASTYGKFPLGVYDASGKKLGLSWRVAILPFVEQANLYGQFKLNEPWDSDNNKKLIPLMPKFYAPPASGGKPGFTYYRSFTGPGTVSALSAAGKPGGNAFGLQITSITDGTSNTGLVAEAGDPVEWTKPDELEYTAGKPLPRLGGIFGDGFHIGMADASVRWLPVTTPPATIEAIITANGGEVVALP